MADRDAAESHALILRLLLQLRKDYLSLRRSIFLYGTEQGSWGTTVLFVLHSEIKRSGLNCGSFVRDATLWGYCLENDKQAFPMFLIVISARSHLQASTSSILFLPLIQSIPGDKKKKHRFKSWPLRNYRPARRAGGCRWTRKNVQVRSGGVKPGGTTAVARGPERGLPRPGRGLCLPAATWHRTRAQGSIMQAWPRNPEQGRDSYILQQAPFSWQTWGKLMLLLCLSFWKRNGYT